MTSPPTTADRTGSAVFHLCVAMGLVASVALAVHEAGQKPPVEVVETFEERREGEAWIVEADVRNRSDVARCPEIRVAARDTETRDLDVAVAEPVSGRAGVPPGATVRYRAVITNLTNDEYEEELEEFSAYVHDDGTCRPVRGAS